MSASSGHHLPSEITEAILPFLPAKSLGRFKSVSKAWNSLISDPQFVKTHRHQTAKLILISDSGSLYSLDISQLFQSPNNDDDISVTVKELSFRSPPIRWKQMLGSCNGLVLAKDETDTVSFLNPTTQEVWNVPPSPFDGDFYVRYGFGYDSSTDDYKVISISFWDPNRVPDPDLHVSVYSLRNNSWRELPTSPYDHRAHHVISSAFTNQNLNFQWSQSSSTITAFSLSNEEFKEIELPDSIVNDGLWIRVYYLVDFGGRLGLYLSDGEGYELWEYGVGERWSRVCSVGVKMDPVNPVCLVEGSKRVIVLDDEKEGGVVVYDVDERRCRNVRMVMVGGPSGFRFTVGGAYVETLESLKRTITP